MCEKFQPQKVLGYNMVVVLPMDFLVHFYWFYKNYVYLYRKINKGNNSMQLITVRVFYSRVSTILNFHLLMDTSLLNFPLRCVPHVSIEYICLYATYNVFVEP